MNWRKITCVIVTAIILCLSNALALEKMSIAVMDLEPQGVDSSIARTLSEIMRTELLNTGRFEVLERAQMDRIIAEMKLQQTGLTDAENAAQLGKLLNVEKLIIGSIGRMGDTYQLNVRLVDVLKAITELAERTECPAREEKLPATITDLINQVAHKIPIRGTVVQVDGEKIITDIGSTHGLNTGLTLRVVRKGNAITDLEGNVLGTSETNIGVILVEEVHPMWSKAIVYGEAAQDMEQGDWVILDLSEAQTIETPAKPPSEKPKKPDTKKDNEEGEESDFEPPPAF